MYSLRWTGLVAILLSVAAAANVPYAARKDAVQLRIVTASGSSSQVRLITRGLRYVTPERTRSRQPWQVIATLPVPVELTLAGVGEADVIAVDSTVVLRIEAKEAFVISAPVQRASGRAIRIHREGPGKPFKIAST